MTCYNQAPYIAQAIRSVLAQKTDFPFRLIIQDDASTDGTAQIVADFAHLHPDIIKPVLFEENMLSQGHRVIALAWPRLKGEFVAFLDGDDAWTNDQKLATQVAFLEKNKNCALCQTMTSWWGVNSNTEYYVFPKEEDRKTFSDLEDLAPGNFIQTSSVMFRRSALRRLPRGFNKIPFGDYAIFALIARKGQIGLIEDVMTLYRVHDNSFWSTTSVEERVRKTDDVKRFIMAHIPIYERPPWQLALDGTPLPQWYIRLRNLRRWIRGRR